MVQKKIRMRMVVVVVSVPVLFVVQLVIAMPADVLALDAAFAAFAAAAAFDYYY